MTPVLADTGVLYALQVRRDQHFHRATEELGLLKTAGVSVIACQPVLIEAYSLMLYRHGTSHALAFLTTLQQGSSWLSPIVSDTDAAFDLLKRYPDQALSFVDAHLAILSSRLGLAVWTFDAHFERLHTKVWKP